MINKNPNAEFPSRYFTEFMKYTIEYNMRWDPNWMIQNYSQFNKQCNI